MNKHDTELAELKAEREKDEKMRKAGYLIGPDGRWIPVAVWKAHIAKLRKRAEESPEWAP